MNIHEIRAHQEMKEHLMRHEGTHPANKTEMHHYKHHAQHEVPEVNENYHGADLL